MSNLAIVQTNSMMSVEQMRERINGVQRVMQSVMKENTHYGVIPGTKKPTLYKAGSEVLLTTFHIGLKLEVDDLSTSDEIRYRVKAVGYHQPTSGFVGEGIGECSTGEEKYKWRTAICDEEYDATPESRRRIKFQKSWDKYSRSHNILQIKQIRTEPADLANTALKMAKKRAQIDFTLTALGASDIFTQDIEDLPDELRHNVDEEGRPTPAGEPIAHPSLEAAANVQELAKAMNGLKADERKKFMPYYQKRQQELKGASDE